MSGGSYDYAHERVGDMASSLEIHSHDTPLRLAFATHLRLVAEAMRAVEWVDSCDMGEGEDEAAIRAVIGPWAELGAALTIADNAREALETAMARARVLMEEKS